MDVLNLGLLMTAMHIIDDVASATTDEVTEPCLSLRNKLGVYTAPVEHLEVRLPSEDRFNLKPVCRLYGDYTSCMEPHQENITQDIQQRQQNLDAVFHPLCKEHFKRYMGHYDCYRRMRKYYGNCRRKRQSKLPLGARTPRGHFWCRITNDYVTCMYSVTALGCSIDAAHTYLVLVNGTLTSLPHTGPVCTLKNPLDILKTTTTQNPVTSPHYLLRLSSPYSGRYPAARSWATHSCEYQLSLSIFCCLVVYILRNCR
ncbi:uncharacterized protein [Haliotis cracherodii]|uniref:uncharacterized protein n=1 Tax=Haliotis cracherodii TaxID=6455 RepID=UPI0039E996CE